MTARCCAFSYWWMPVINLLCSLVWRYRPLLTRPLFIWNKQEKQNAKIRPEKTVKAAAGQQNCSCIFCFHSLCTPPWLRPALSEYLNIACLYFWLLLCWAWWAHCKRSSSPQKAHFSHPVAHHIHVQETELLIGQFHVLRHLQYLKQNRYKWNSALLCHSLRFKQRTQVLPQYSCSPKRFGTKSCEGRQSAGQSSGGCVVWPRGRGSLN